MTEKTYYKKSPHTYCKKVDCVCSFAYHLNSQFWHPTLNGNNTPGMFSRNYGKKKNKTDIDIEFYFTCPTCNHSSQSSIYRVTTAKVWCRFCNDREWKHCDNDDCDFCFNKSFASHEKVMYWHKTKNKILPLHVFKSSDTKYWFICNICGHYIVQKPSSMNKKNRWCLYCSTHWKHCGGKDCSFCFDRSFATHEKSIHWNYDKNDGKKPVDFAVSSQIDCHFTCPVCKHDFEKTPASISQNEWCPYCSEAWKHCDDVNCEWCYNKSFASADKYKDWHPTKNTKEALYLPKSSSVNTCWFLCKKCNHSYDKPLREIYKKNSGEGCPYCNGPSWKHCEDDDCADCYNKSFASHPRCKYLAVEKNINFKPLYNRKGADVLCVFICNECNEEFEKTLKELASGSWCPTCLYKTEKKLKEWLNQKYDDVCCQTKFEWCKNGKYFLKFDFYVPSKNLIIELDGYQHFEQVLDWRSVDINQVYDKYKMKCLLREGLSIIRIFQEDVLNDKNNWQDCLKKAISQMTTERIICIKSNSKDKINEVYGCYESEMIDFINTLNNNPHVEFILEIESNEEIIEDITPENIEEESNVITKII